MPRLPALRTKIVLMHDEYENDAPGPAASSGSRRQLWAAILAIQTSQLHVTASSDHFSEWWGYGVFFAVVALFQFFGGLALLWSNRRDLLWFGLLGTGFVLLIWIVSRTAGIHIGPESVGPEPIGLLDSLCALLEAMQVYCMIRLLRSRESAPLATLLRRSPL
jgi:hypothetical protein